MKNTRYLVSSLVCIGGWLLASAAWAHEVKRPAPSGRAWIGVGGGITWGSVDEPCAPASTSDDCEESGGFGSYSANVTVSGRRGAALRVRGLRASGSENGARTPYETAALVGSRFGRSNWYGLVGAGRILHPDDGFVGDAHGFAWEILFAPASRGPVGFELSFLGNAGEDVDFIGFNTGLRFGSMR